MTRYHELRFPKDEFHDGKRLIWGDVSVGGNIFVSDQAACVLVEIPPGDDETSVRLYIKIGGSTVLCSFFLPLPSQ